MGVRFSQPVPIDLVGTTSERGELPQGLEEPMVYTTFASKFSSKPVHELVRYFRGCIYFWGIAKW